MTSTPYTPPTPDMTILNESYYQQPAFPLHVFPEQLQTWLVENQQATGAPIDYGAGVILAACAALIGNSCHVGINPKWHEPSNLFVSLVGAPASGKTPAEAPIFRLLHKLEDYHNRGFDQSLNDYQERLSIAKKALKTWEKAVEAATANNEPIPPKPKEAQLPERPTRHRMIVQDATVEQFIKIQQENPRGVLLARDELTGWLSSMTRYKGGSGTDRPFWLEAHAGGPYTVDRVKHSDDPIKVPRLGVTILGGIQPDKLKRIVDDDDDGLVARFLYLWPQRGAIVPYTDGANMAMIERLFNRLNDGLPTQANPHLIAFTGDGSGSFLAFRQAMQNGAVYYHGPLAGVYGKAAGHAGRLALVLTLIEWALSGSPTVPDDIPYQTQVNAVQLMEQYFIPMAHRVLDSVSRPAAESYGRTLAKWLVNHKQASITKRDIYKTHRIAGLSSPTKAQVAIDELVDANWLHPEPATGGRIGRPSERYLVNPSIYPAE